jgi:hypothetical protein
MKRVILTPNLPRQTSAMKRFEKSAIEINKFYWSFRCSLQYTLPALKSVKRIPDIIPGDVGKKMNVTSSQFILEAPDTERFARHSVLVLYITIFEEYLREILTSFLLKTWKIDRTYKISFQPQELPISVDLTDYLKQKAICSTVEEILGKNYSSRFDSIRNLIVQGGKTSPALSPDTVKYAIAACEARNCIIHSSGKADSRAVSHLKTFMPSLRIDNYINIDENLLWNFLGSLRDSVRAIDVAIRSK